MWQWDDVRFFLAVSRNRSLSGAARALRVDHVTVGRRIAAFEERLGAKLLAARPRDLRSPPPGKRSWVNAKRWRMQLHRSIGS
jgi:DNA-binding transcriptional LysR family regulator